MTMQHTSLKGELLYLIGRATTPLSCADLYEKCELADEVAKVAKALANLQSDGKIVRVEGDGRARYKLAPGVTAPAPAGKKGRSRAVQADDAARAAARPAPTEAGLPVLDTHTLADPGIGLGGAAGKTQRATASLADTDPAILRAGATAAAKHVLAKPDMHKASRGDESLADAIIAKLRKQLSEQSMPLQLPEASPAPIIHIHIEQVDVHLGGL